MTLQQFDSGSEGLFVWICVGPVGNAVGDSGAEYTSNDDLNDERATAEQKIYKELKEFLST